VSTPRSLEEWLRAAWRDPAAGCPPPEVWLEDELAALSPADRHRLEAHAETCPACAGERELARAFDSGANEAEAGDVQWLTERLAARSPVAVEQAARPTAAEAANTTAAGNVAASTVVPFPGRRVVRWTRLAAAAALVVAAGLAYQALQPTGPELPERSQAGAVRGGVVEVIAPVGELAQLPAELSWRAVVDAAVYRLRLTSPDDTVLWQVETAATEAQVPAEVAAGLQRAVAYRWNVEAMAADGTVVGRSETARFRAAPEPEGEAESTP
jgi:hypothetical protein